jgi:ubiquinone/menaquinone biosynthesis C-methylase UbiE
VAPEVPELARRRQAGAGVENLEFPLGTIEDIPLPDKSVDVVISNCVINLSVARDQVDGAVANAFIRARC